MKNSKQDVIDWLINNDELVRDIIKKTNKQIESVDSLFREEALDQQLDQVSMELADQLGRDLGLTVEDLSETMDKETLRKFLGAI